MEWARGYIDIDRFNAGVQGRLWTELQPEFLDFHGEIVHYLRPPAYAEVLPALVVTVLRHNDHLNMLPNFLISALTRRADPPRLQARFEQNVASLTDSQRRVIGDVVEYLAAFGRSEDQRADAAAALSSFWSEMKASNPLT